MLTATLTKDEIQQAICDYMEKQGFLTTDRFAVNMSVSRGDRPYESDTVTVQVTGILHK